MGTLLQEQDNERQLPLVLTAGDFSLYEDCIPYFDSFTKKNFYLGTALLTVSKCSVLGGLETADAQQLAYPEIPDGMLNSS